MNKIYFFAIALILFSAACTNKNVEFHISPSGSDDNSGTIEYPLASIHKARDMIRALDLRDRRSDIIVYLRGGTYTLKETLVLGTEDSAPEGFSVTYKAYKDEIPILSSARKIKGWNRTEATTDGLPTAARGKVWVVELPEIKEGKWFFRTLYDGDKLISRAKSEPFSPTNDLPESILKHRYRPDLRSVLHFPEGAICNWSNLEDIEIFAKRDFLGIAEVDEKNNIAALRNFATYSLGYYDGQKFKPYWVENTIEGLDEPGEWVLNSNEGKLYYWPENDNPGDNMQAPFLDELIRVEGKNVESVSGDVPVTGIHFEGISFSFTKRDVRTIDDGFIQHGWEAVDKDNGAIRFRSAKDCSIKSCKIFNTGAIGIRLDLFAQNIEISGNQLYNIGSYGIFLCGYGPGIKDVNKNNLIINNEIHDLSRLRRGSGILLWQSGLNQIKNNLIYNNVSHAITISGVRPRYFGIYDGHKWKDEYEDFKKLMDLQENMNSIRWDEVGEPQDYRDVWKFSHSRNNIVQDNEIHDVMLISGDGNAIYLSGGGLGNIIDRNLIYRFNAWAIRTDDDQDGVTMTQNIIVGKSFKLKHTLNKIENNIMINGGTGNLVIMTNSPDCSIKSNVFIDSDYFFSKNNFSPNYLDETKRIEINNNLFFEYGDSEFEQLFTEMKEMGYDKDGIYANPLFVDYMNGDLNLKDNSPLHSLGFVAIDTDKIGLYDNPAFPRLRKKGFIESIDITEILDEKYRLGM